MVESSLLEKVLRLPPDDRRELMDELSASLAPEVPLTPELQALLDERLADFEARPDAFRPWDEVKDELLGKYCESFPIRSGT